MFAIVLKIILVSALLLAVYYIFFEKEKVLKFNRFYLLFSLVFAYTIPFISLTIPNFEKSKPNLIIGNVVQQQAVFVSSVEQNNVNWMILIPIIYASVALFFLIKAIISVYKILNLKGQNLMYQHQKIKILEKEIAPFSFLNKIYFGKNYWIDNNIDQRIFLHEKLHVLQKHSLDILLLEILKIISWFNPVLHFYKKAMINNHEFLADENVVNNNYGIKSYQHLILDEIIYHQNYQLTHQFNFNNTKKRFIMMTKSKSKLANLKKFLILPLFAIFFVAFANKKPSEIVENNFSNSEKIFKEKIPLPQNLESKILTKSENDTIKPKVKKTEAAIKTEIKNEVAKASQSKSAEPILPPPPVDKIESHTEAEFPGGLTALRNKFSENFDPSKLENTKGIIKGTIVLIISDDGKRYNDSYDFDNESFKKAAKNSIEKSLEGVVWKPATLNGKPVASSFKMPMTMSFE
ncbi:M56 family metallopeptidase [Cloacibacterium sp.]|uniref:M56 family metallopeptidase n=1 Tax=Cloacibacterium sp. TaxID=1913682 RepID=UPI0039E5F8AF